MRDDAAADLPDTHTAPDADDAASHDLASPDELSARAADLTTTIARLLHEGNYLDAVIYARDRGQLGVRQARGLVEHIAEHEGLRVPKSGCAALANAVLIVIGLAAAALA